MLPLFPPGPEIRPWCTPGAPGPDRPDHAPPLGAGVCSEARQSPGEEGHGEAWASQRQGPPELLSLFLDGPGAGRLGGCCTPREQGQEQTQALREEQGQTHEQGQAEEQEQAFAGSLAQAQAEEPELTRAFSQPMKRASVTSPVTSAMTSSFTLSLEDLEARCSVTEEEAPHRKRCCLASRGYAKSAPPGVAVDEREPFGAAQAHQEAACIKSPGLEALNKEEDLCMVDQEPATAKPPCLQGEAKKEETIVAQAHQEATEWKLPMPSREWALCQALESALNRQKQAHAPAAPPQGTVSPSPSAHRVHQTSAAVLRTLPGGKAALELRSKGNLVRTPSPEQGTATLEVRGVTGAGGEGKEEGSAEAGAGAEARGTAGAGPQESTSRAPLPKGASAEGDLAEKAGAGAREATKVATPGPASGVPQQTGRTRGRPDLCALLAAASAGAQARKAAKDKDKEKGRGSGLAAPSSMADRVPSFGTPLWSKKERQLLGSGFFPSGSGSSFGGPARGLEEVSAEGFGGGLKGKQGQACRLLSALTGAGACRADPGVPGGRVKAGERRKLEKGGRRSPSLEGAGYDLAQVVHAVLARQQGFGAGSKQGSDAGTKRGLDTGAKQGLDSSTKQGLDIGTKDGGANTGAGAGAGAGSCRGALDGEVDASASASASASPLDSSTSSGADGDCDRMAQELKELLLETEARIRAESPERSCEDVRRQAWRHLWSQLDAKRREKGGKTGAMTPGVFYGCSAFF